MRKLNKIMNVIICTMLIIIIGFLGGYMFGATSTEQRYGGRGTVSGVISTVAQDVCNNASGVNALQAEIQSLNLRLEQYQAENAKLEKLLADEKQKGVLDKVGDNFTAAADSAVAVWKDITD